MSKHTKKSFHEHGLRFITGWIFIVLGILGLFLPILQGILFLAIGFYLLAPYIPLFRRWQILIYKRFPGLRHRIYSMKKRHRQRRSEKLNKK